MDRYLEFLDSQRPSKAQVNETVNLHLIEKTSGKPVDLKLEVESRDDCDTSVVLYGLTEFESRTYIATVVLNYYENPYLKDSVILQYAH